MDKPVKRLRRPRQGWKQFAEDVAKTAKPKQSRPAANVQNLRPGRVHLLHRAPQCTATARITGKRCQLRCVRGAQRCYKHGGLLEVPEHPANAARYFSGKIQAKLDSISAREAFYRYDASTRQTVNQAIMSSIGGEANWQCRVSGAAALTTNDNGKAFRRWQTELKTNHKQNQTKKQKQINALTKHHSQKVTQ